MSTLRETAVLQAAMTQLNTGTPGGVPQTQRSRADDIAPASLPAMGLRPVVEDVTRPGGARGPLSKRTLLMALDCWGVATGSAAIDQVIDPMLEWATKALGGSNLGGLVDQVNEVKLAWKSDFEGQPYGKATVYFEVHYQTRVNDATVAA